MNEDEELFVTLLLSAGFLVMFVTVCATLMFGAGALVANLSCEPACTDLGAKYIAWNPQCVCECKNGNRFRAEEADGEQCE